VLLGRLSIQHGGRHGQDLRFEFRAAGHQIALQQISMGKQTEDAIKKIIVLVTAMIHGARDGAGLPQLVFLARYGFQLSKDVLRCPPLSGQFWIGLKTILVGIQITHDIGRK